MKDAALQARVTRLRQLISEATPIPPRSPANDSSNKSAFEYFEFNSLPVELDQSYRAVALREINRLVKSYDWRDELTRQLDRMGLCSMAQMDDGQIEMCVSRFKSLENCVQYGLDAPDAPPAR